MKYLNTKILILSLLMLAVAAVPGFAKTNGLSMQKWQLVELNGQMVTRSKAFIQFNENQARFTGNTGCNQMFGSVAVIGRRINIARVGTTRMLCTDRGANRTEAALVKALEAATRYRLIGNTLELSDKNRVIARFHAARGSDDDHDDSGLGDKKWMLESIKGTPIANAARGAFLVFDRKKMSAGGDSSCNVFGGSYKVDGRRIAITEIVSTMRACVEDERMEIERAFFDSLEKADRYAIDNNKLTLHRGRTPLLTFRGRPK